MPAVDSKETLASRLSGRSTVLVPPDLIAQPETDFQFDQTIVQRFLNPFVLQKPSRQARAFGNPFGFIPPLILLALE